MRLNLRECIYKAFWRGLLSSAGLAYGVPCVGGGLRTSPNWRWKILLATIMKENLHQEELAISINLS